MTRRKQTTRLPRRPSLSATGLTRNSFVVFFCVVVLLFQTAFWEASHLPLHEWRGIVQARRAVWEEQGARVPVRVYIQGRRRPGLTLSLWLWLDSASLTLLW